MGRYTPDSTVCHSLLSCVGVSFSKQVITFIVSVICNFILFSIHLPEILFIAILQGLCWSYVSASNWICATM